MNEVQEEVDFGGGLYERLPVKKGTSEIRLLDLTLPSIHETDHLSGSLRVVNLDERPTFAALSYVWGGSSSKLGILKLGSSQVKVGENCFLALKQLLGHFKTLTIWVDALCINQADEDEKAWQIPLMGTIYTIASPTYVWLGEGSSLSEEGMKYLATAGFQLEYARYADNEGLVSRRTMVSLAWKSFRKTWLVVLGATLPSTYDPLKGASATISTISPRPVWDQKVSGATLHEILSREWIDRIWTFQELLLSPDPILCCGTQLVHWRSVNVSILFLEKFRWLFARGSPSPLLTAWTGIALLWNLINNEPNTAPGEQTVSAHDCNRSRSDLGVSPEYSYFVEIVYQVYLFIFLCSCSLIVLPIGAAIDCGFGFKYIFTHLKAKPYLIVPAHVLLLVIILSTNCCLAGLVMIWKRLRYKEWLSTLEQRKVFVNEVYVRQTSDLRDKSFGIHAILEKMRVSMKKPDYSRSEEEIHEELSRCLLKWTGSLDLLICRGKGQNIGHCSWMPDWHQIVRRGSLNESYILGIHIPPKWDAIKRLADDGENRPMFSLRDNNQLVVRGRHLGRIHECFEGFQATSMNYKEDERPIHLKNLQTIHKVIHKVKQRPLLRPWSNPIFFYASRTSLASLKIREVVPMGDGLQVRPVLHRIQTSLLRNIRDTNVANETFDKFRRSLDYFAWWRFPPRRIDEFVHCINWFNQRAEDRCTFALTADDKLIYATQHAEVNDFIVFIWGISLPVVLRRVGEHCCLIGFARVEGVDMNRLAAENNDADLEEMVIV